MQIASLFARIGLQTDEQKLKSFNTGLKGTRATLIAVGAAVTAVSVAITKVTSDALDSAAAFKQFEAETGASSTQLQRWQAVAEQTNSSAEAVSSAVRAIALNQERIRLGEGDISGFQLLGIDPDQDPFAILSELRTRTEGLSEAMQRNVLGRLGVGAELLQTIQLSQDRFDELANRSFIISPQAIDTLAETRAALTQAGRGLDFLKTQIAVGLAPQLKELSDNLIAFIQRNQETFVKGFQRAFEIMTRFVRAIGDAVRLIDRGVRATIGWENALKILIAALVLMNSTLLLSPIGLITAGIILLIALLEDIAVYSRGGKSLIGLLIEEFPVLGDVIEGALSGISNAIEIIKGVLSGELSIKDVLEEWGALGAAVAVVTTFLQRLAEISLQSFNDSVQRMKDLFQSISDIIAGEEWVRLDNLGPVGRAVAGGLQEGTQEGFGAGVGTFFRELGTGLWERGGEVVDRIFNNDVNIEINGVSDPEDIARRLESEILPGVFAAPSTQRGSDE